MPFRSLRGLNTSFTTVQDDFICMEWKPLGFPPFSSPQKICSTLTGGFVSDQPKPGVLQSSATAGATSPRRPMPNTPNSASLWQINLNIIPPKVDENSLIHPEREKRHPSGSGR